VLEPAPTSGGGEGSDGDAQVRALRRKQHQTVRKVTQDMERFSFNTMIAALMEYTNHMVRAKETPVAQTAAWQEATKTLLLLMAPSFPHISEELWERAGHDYSIHQQAWPTWDDELAAEETITIVVQVNGKVRDRFEAPADIGEEEAKEQALATPGAQKHLNGKQPLKVIYVPGRLVNIVVK